MTTQLSADKPTIKILIYTDDPQVSLSDESGEFLGLGSMDARLKAHAPAFAKLETTLVSRNSDTAHHADNKINDILEKETFDEIWFFGLHQANTERFSLAAFRGGPESELTAAEVAALEKWMKGNAEDGSEGGGVLMTGDHANEVPPKLLPDAKNPCGDTATGATFLGLGRAIGRCVPRAGLLRQWEGPPTYHPENSYNTIAESGFQLDRIPQQLVLQNVNADGDPDPNGQPHPLFFYRPGQFIQVFPDHTHEGAVILPKTFHATVWPNGPNGQVRPHVVAFGRDKRLEDPLNIIATYNGDVAGVGRIVADSTWHHYMNLNLRGFEHPASVGSVSDQIGQFYGNLAVWLAPRAKRAQMARAMTWRLAQHTLLLERQSDSERTGETAYSALLKVASPCEIHEAMQALAPKNFAVVSSAAADTNLNYLPTPQLILGSVLDSYHRVMIEAETAPADFEETASLTQSPRVDSLINAAYKNAFEEQAKRLRKTSDALSRAASKAQ